MHLITYRKTMDWLKSKDEFEEVGLACHTGRCPFVQMVIEQNPTIIPESVNINYKVGRFAEDGYGGFPLSLSYNRHGRWVTVDVPQWAVRVIECMDILADATVSFPVVEAGVMVDFVKENV